MEEPPPEHCGYTYPPDYEVGSEPNHENSCYRESLPNTGRCAWHAHPDETHHKTIENLRAARAPTDIRDQNRPAGELLDGAVLVATELEDALSFANTSLREADLPGANLFRADLTDANLGGADLTDAYLSRADLPGADLGDADMTGVDARNATFDTSTRRIPLGGPRRPGNPTADNTPTPRYGIAKDAVERGLITAHDVSKYHSYPNLEDAICENADFRGAEFTNARLYQADLTNARINAETKFDNQTETTIYERDHTLNGWFTKTTDTGAKAGAWVHRRLERLLKNNALSERSRESHVRKQEAERTHHCWSADWPPTNGDSLSHWGRWTVLTLSGGLTRHGESLRRVVVWAIGVVLTAAFLFPWVGGFHSQSKDHTFRLVLGGPVDIGEIVTTYGQSLYFSVITFSTIGYGDLSPRGVGSQVLVGLESLLGALLVALFIFVLGRRTER